MFNSTYSPINNYPGSQLAGYQSAVTKERVSWKQVKEYSIYIWTATIEKYGLKEGQTISLIDRNTIWYPVTIFGGLRVGML